MAIIIIKPGQIKKYADKAQFVNEKVSYFVDNAAAEEEYRKVIAARQLPLTAAPVDIRSLLKNQPSPQSSTGKEAVGIDSWLRTYNKASHGDNQTNRRLKLGRIRGLVPKKSVGLYLAMGSRKERELRKVALG